MLKNIIIVTLILCLYGGKLASAQVPDGAPAPAVQLSLEPFHRIDLGNLESFRRELTLRCLGQLQDADFRNLLASRLGPDQTRASLNQVVDDWAELFPTPGHRQFAARLRELDRDLRERMGIDRTARSILGLQVVWPATGPQRLDWNRTLFAVRPQHRGTGPAFVEAYDRRGRMVKLDPRTPPAVPVILAGSDRREAVRAGLETVNRGLRQAGFAADHRADAPARPIECAKLTAIRLAEDQESWWEGGVETYALVSGIDPAADKPNIKLVNLPYLRHEATDYFPDQVILFWSDYRFSAANLQFWDHGDATDYKEILDAVLKGAAAAMTAAGAPVYAWIPVLADAILQSMPASWWKGEDTWLDTFYALEKGQACQDRLGAGRTVRISLVPWTLQPQ
jgi:hypothetical protein